MPELPEVETVKRTLQRQISNEKITDFQVFYEPIIAFPSVNELEKRICHQTIHNIERRGKWLLFILDTDVLLSHLRMEGKYFMRTAEDPIEKHEHVAITFESGKQLRYRDTRKFGRMYLFLKDQVYQQKPLSLLGLEPWDKSLTRTYLKEKYRGKNIPIKEALLDQGIITGIGNIYADEILFLSKINPMKPSQELSNLSLEKIIQNTRNVLLEAIEAGGTTIRSYTSSEGVHGRFQQSLLVHNHEGEPCPICGTTILKIRVGGRGTYYCKKCQK